MDTIIMPATDMKHFNVTSMTSGALIRLMHLVSPSLPTGGFAYSQGLEWAVESGWITDAATLETWLDTVLMTSMSGVDIPLFSRLYHAAGLKDFSMFADTASQVNAFRETRELRMEEKNRGRALSTILRDLDLPGLDGSSSHDWHGVISACQLAGFAFAAAKWAIPLSAATSGYVWSWLENQVVSAIKIMPLGQTPGQRILSRLAQKIDIAVSIGFKKQDHEIGASLPALAIGSSLHETQYTRLFRS